MLHPSLRAVELGQHFAECDASSIDGFSPLLSLWIAPHLEDAAIPKAKLVAGQTEMRGLLVLVTDLFTFPALFSSGQE